LADFLPYTDTRRVAANVRYLREQVHNWSRGELAERAKIGLRTLRNIEEDRVFQPKMTTITGLANAFGISVSELRKPFRNPEQAKDEDLVVEDSLADFLPYTDTRRVAANVRYLREQVHNWSREELAERAKIGVRRLRNIEEHRVFQPKMTTITGLANAFGISVAELTESLRSPKPAEQEDWRSHLASLEQQRLGARWVEGEGRFIIDPRGAESDIEAAQNPVVLELHQPIIQKALLFRDSSRRLDNALGWHGITAASQRFLDGVQRPTHDIPNHWVSFTAQYSNLDHFLNKIPSCNRVPVPLLIP
jgi:transcriptional regulator with XRE-family HTH domain